MDVAPGRNQPVWITVRVPAAARPGDYRADVIVSSAAGAIGTLPTAPHGAGRDAAPVADRPFSLDVWAHPDAVADYLGLQPWSDAHFAALAPYWSDLAATGQRVINLAIAEDPWLVDHQGTIRAQTRSPYRSTVEWRWDGARFSFGFEVFDRIVSDALMAGIGPDIHAFGLLQFQRAGPHRLHGHAHRGEDVGDHAGGIATVSRGLDDVPRGLRTAPAGERVARTHATGVR